jgi:hypothetical protein
MKKLKIVVVKILVVMNVGMKIATKVVQFGKRKKVVRIVNGCKGTIY